MTGSAKKFVEEPSATVGLGLNSAAIHDVSYDSLLFIALEYSACKSWLVRFVKESDCKVTDYDSHVQRVLTRSDCRVEADIVTLVEEKGEALFVVEGHDVERVTAKLKNPHCSEIYRRNARDKLRTLTDAASEMVKLVGRLKVDVQCHRLQHGFT